MADKKKTVLHKTLDGKTREIDLGIYGKLSKAGIAALDKMMNDTSPVKKKKAVRKTAK